MRWIALAVLLAAAGCGSAEIVTGAELEELKKIRFGALVCSDAVEFAKLKQDAETGRNVGRYSQYRNGARVWRLDSATGHTCLLLASEADWKKPDVANQGCIGP